MIEAKIIKHSVSSINKKEIITYELTYPRMIHSELMTHRVFSRNAASSRAIPIDKLIELVETDCAFPSEWGLNKAGMQSAHPHDDPELCKATWLKAAQRAVESARELQALGLHKQICNRVIEPFQYIKTIVTATEWNNWFWLRNHEAADPTIQELARKMLEAKEQSVPQVLNPFEWHLPYVSKEDLEIYGLDNAIKISASCCAQVSYRALDTSIEKALKIYDMLMCMDRIHASPFEHLATPMGIPNYNGDDPRYAPSGAHVDSKGRWWSGNFQGWYQYRQTIPNNNKE